MCVKRNRRRNNNKTNFVDEMNNIFNETEWEMKTTKKHTENVNNNNNYRDVSEWLKQARIKETRNKLPKMTTEDNRMKHTWANATQHTEKASLSRRNRSNQLIRRIWFLINSLFVCACDWLSFSFPTLFHSERTEEGEKSKAFSVVAFVKLIDFSL